MDQSHGGNAMPDTVSFAFKMFSRARQAVSRMFVPALDLLPDGGVSLEDVNVANGGTVSPGKQVTFIADGYLVGVTGSVQSGTAADYATTKVAILINGSTSIITAGQQGQGYATFGQLFGTAGDGRMFRLMAPIRQSIPYVVYIKYEGANSTVTADLCFWYCNTVSPPLTT